MLFGNPLEKVNLYLSSVWQLCISIFIVIHGPSKNFNPVGVSMAKFSRFWCLRYLEMHCPHSIEHKPQDTLILKQFGTEVHTLYPKIDLFELHCIFFAKLIVSHGVLLYMLWTIKDRFDSVLHITFQSMKIRSHMRKRNE